MTPDERNMISDLANKIAKTPAPPRDPEAEDFVRTHIGNRPDALYLMTQTVLIQNMAIQQAQRQISELQQRAGGSSVSPVSGGSFLGGASTPTSSAPPQQQYAQPSYSQPSYAQPSFAQPAASSGPPSFLRGAAQTAAGVAAGTLAVQGIESLFHGGGLGSGLGGFGGGFGGFGGGGRPEETVVNNYYDSPGGGGNLGGNDLSLGDNRDNFADTSDLSDNSTDYSDTDLADDSSFDSSGDDFS